MTKKLTFIQCLVKSSHLIKVPKKINLNKYQQTFCDRGEHLWCCHITEEHNLIQFLHIQKICNLSYLDNKHLHTQPGAIDYFIKNSKPCLHHIRGTKKLDVIVFIHPEWIKVFHCWTAMKSNIGCTSFWSYHIL